MNREEFLAVCEQFVGGDLETHEDGDVYRGPIKSIELDGSMVRVEGNWTAISRDMGITWEVWHISTFGVALDLIRKDSSGRLTAAIPALGIAVFFPKGGSKLDPAKVKRLTLTV
jgi:hypothetical protein